MLIRPIVLCVFGTRPEAIKMAPVVLAIARALDLELKVCVTAQHRQMLDQVLDLFGIVPDVDLDLMQPGQTLSDLTGRVLTKLTPVLKALKPDLVLVHGDTTTTMAASLASFYEQIPVAHVEAGLRTDDLYNPFPEEMNRRLTSQLTRLHFAPTATARRQLERDGIDPRGIYLTGNTVIDALLETASKVEPASIEGRVILVTAHRRENWGEPLKDICLAVRDLVERNPDVRVVFPAHLNPIVQNTAREILGNLERVRIIDPLDYAPFVKAMKESHLILTDSGGVQEEGPSLGKPVLVMRTTTERPEAVEAGTVRLVGVKRADIFRNAQELLDDAQAYARMANAVNPYGDGHAAERIVEAIRYFFGLRSDRPTSEFAPG